MQTTIQANDIDDAIEKLQNLKSVPINKPIGGIQKFKGITPSNCISTELELDWYRQ